MRIDLRALVASLALVLLVPTGARADSDRSLLSGFARSELAIATPDARLHRLEVWIADTPARRARGLMWVRDLPDDTGMLFVYPAPQVISMWMKNTRIPLDMLFVRADGRIVHIVENTTPYSLESIRSSEPVLGVIELEGGMAAKLGIHPGARVQHPAFGASRQS
jgi:uncharacterized membrane protein (UPF0127 family)